VLVTKSQRYTAFVAVRCSGITLVSINKVNLYWAYLVLGWGDHFQVQLPMPAVYLSM